MIKNYSVLSEEVRQLVNTVGRLPSADQERILRVVSLLKLAPENIQKEGQQMLRTLIEASPHLQDCESGVDGVIEYLEDRILGVAEIVADSRVFYCPPVSHRRN
jgi:hypothetical protein